VGVKCEEGCGGEGDVEKLGEVPVDGTGGGLVEGVTPGERLAEREEDGMTIIATWGMMAVSMLSALSYPKLPATPLEARKVTRVPSASTPSSSWVAEAVALMDDPAAS